MDNAISQMMKYHQAAGHYPGALAHVENDGVVLAREVFGSLYGQDNRPNGPALSEHARFRIASLTKGMVSMVALRLVDRGQLSLDEPIADVLPELRQCAHRDGGAPVRMPSLRDLLRHTGGFGNLGEVTDPTIRVASAKQPIEGQLALLSRSKFLQMLAQRPLTAEPGTRFQYGFSTDVAGLMIERVTGNSLQRALSEHLFEPLGMSNTSFRIDPVDHAAMPQAFDQDQTWHAFVKTFNRADHEALTHSSPPDSLEGPMHSGGGGLVSTLDDVASYARMLAAGGLTAAGGEKIVSDSLFAEAMTNQLGPTVPGPYNFTGGGWGFGLAGAIRNNWAPAAVPSEPGEFAWSGVTGHTLYVKPGSGWFALMLSSNTASRVIVRLEFRRAASRLA